MQSQKQRLHLHDKIELPFATIYVSTDEIPSDEEEYETLITIEPREKPNSLIYDTEIYVEYKNRDKAIMGHAQLLNILRNLKPDIIEEKKITVVEPNEEKVKELANEISKLLPYARVH